MGKKSTEKRLKKTSPIKLLTVFISIALGIGLFAQLDKMRQEKERLTHLKAVSSDTVCMVTNRWFGKPQTPVKVENKVYYGCCDMCEKTLRQDPTSRQATDPLSGATVDKATAVIGALPNGTVYYFGTAMNLNQFRTQEIKKNL